MSQERLIGKKEVEVVLIEYLNSAIDASKYPVVTTLPARFKANGLPYEVEFLLNKDADITNLKICCSNGIENETKLPIERLRSMAIAETTLIVPTLEKLKGKTLYKRISEIYKNTPFGVKRNLIAQHFGFTVNWADKHLAIGKQKYPEYFKTCNKTKQKRRK